MSTSKKLSMSLDDIIANGSKNAKTNGSVPGAIKKASRAGQSNKNGPYASQKATTGKFFGSRQVIVGQMAVKRRYTVRVSGLLPNTGEGCVKSHFGKCGKVFGVNFPERGVAVVQYENVISCSAAIRQLNGIKVNGAIITVEPGQPVDLPVGTTPQAPMRSAPPPPAALFSSSYTPVSLQQRAALTPPVSNYYTTREVNLHANNSSHEGYVYVPNSSHQLVEANGMISGVGRPSKAEEQLLRPPIYINVGANGNSVSSRLLNERTSTGGTATVVVSNVPHDLTAQEIQDAFSCVGTVLRTEVMLNSHGSHTGRVAVMFENRIAAEDAVRRFDGGDLNHNTIRVFLE